MLWSSRKQLLGEAEQRNVGALQPPRAPDRASAVLGKVPGCRKKLHDWHHPGCLWCALNAIS